jgi:hypothetical protein
MYNSSKTIMERKKRALGIWDGKDSNQEKGGAPLSPDARAKIEMDAARALVGEGKDIMSILCECFTSLSTICSND